VKKNSPTSPISSEFHMLYSFKQSVYDIVCHVVEFVTETLMNSVIAGTAVSK
jgi:hypothetical protein